MINSGNADDGHKVIPVDHEACRTLYHHVGESSELVSILAYVMGDIDSSDIDMVMGTEHKYAMEPDFKLLINRFWREWLKTAVVAYWCFGFVPVRVAQLRTGRRFYVPEVAEPDDHLYYCVRNRDGPVEIIVVAKDDEKGNSRPTKCSNGYFVMTEHKPIRVGDGYLPNSPLMCMLPKARELNYLRDCNLLASHRLSNPPIPLSFLGAGVSGRDPQEVANNRVLEAGLVRGLFDLSQSAMYDEHAPASEIEKDTAARFTMLPPMTDTRQVPQPQAPPHLDRLRDRVSQEYYGVLGLPASIVRGTSVASASEVARDAQVANKTVRAIRRRICSWLQQLYYVCFAVEDIQKMFDISETEATVEHEDEGRRAARQRDQRRAPYKDERFKRRRNGCLHGAGDVLEQQVRDDTVVHVTMSGFSTLTVESLDLLYNHIPLLTEEQLKLLVENRYDIPLSGMERVIPRREQTIKQPAGDAPEPMRALDKNAGTVSEGQVVGHPKEV